MAAAGDEPLIDRSTPSAARVYGELLGVKVGFEADLEVAEKLAACAPELAGLARDERRFIARAVGRLASLSGIRQFLDLGCGVPARITDERGEPIPLTHEAAGAGAAVVYADTDLLAFTRTAAELDGATGTAVIDRDLADVAGMLGDERVTGVIDLRKPVCVILCAVLNYFADDEARAIVTGYMEALPQYSAAVISVAWFADEGLREQMSALMPGVPWHQHAAEDVESWFRDAGLELARKRVADVQRWPLLGEEERSACMLGGVGLKP